MLACLEITQEEKDALYSFQGTGHKELNALMTSGTNSELSYTASKLSSMVNFNFFETNEQLYNIIETSKLMYSAMVKNMHKYPITNRTLYRGTNKNNLMDKNQSFVSTTTDFNIAKNVFAVNFDKDQAFAEVHINESIPYYNFKNDEDYGSNQEQEILLGPFLNFDIKEYNNSYNVKVTKNNFEKSNITIDDILNIREDYTNTIKKIIENKKTANELANKYDNLDQGIRSGRYDRSDFKYIRENMDQLLNDYSNINKETKQLEINFNNYKQIIQNYLKSSFLEIEKKIELNIENEKIKQQELTELKEKQRKQDEKNLMLNNIKMSINDFIKNYNRFIDKTTYLNQKTAAYDLTPITYDTDKLMNLVQAFYNMLDSLDNSTLKQISIKFKTNDFNEFFKKVSYKDNYQVCSKIKEIICGDYKTQKLIDNNFRLEQIYNNKGILRKISGKEKKEKQEASFLLNQNTSLNENLTYDFDYIKSNLTGNEELNQKIIKDIAYYENIYEHKIYNTNLEDIFELFDINNYNNYEITENNMELEDKKTKGM